MIHSERGHGISLLPGLSDIYRADGLALGFANHLRQYESE